RGRRAGARPGRQAGADREPGPPLGAGERGPAGARRRGGGGAGPGRRRARQGRGRSSDGAAAGRGQGARRRRAGGARPRGAAGGSLAAWAVTTVHHLAAERAEYFSELGLAARVGEWPLGVWAWVPHAQLEAARELGLATGQGGDNFQVGGAKFFADGALGSLT